MTLNPLTQRASASASHPNSEDKTPHRTQHTIMCCSLRVVLHSSFTLHVSFDESSQHVCRVLNSVLAPQSFLHHMSCRNLLDLPDRWSTFPKGLETESGNHCIDPAAVAGLAEWLDQSLPTGYDPKKLIEISNQHTPINVPSQMKRVEGNCNGAIAQMLKNPC